jgi:hypothetical protein
MRHASICGEEFNIEHHFVLLVFKQGIDMLKDDPYLWATSPPGDSVGNLFFSGASPSLKR